MAKNSEGLHPLKPALSLIGMARFRAIASSLHHRYERRAA
jgi:hypothetical protein